MELVIKTTSQEHTAERIAALEADVDGKVHDEQLTIVATLLSCLR